LNDAFSHKAHNFYEDSRSNTASFQIEFGVECKEKIEEHMKKFGVARFDSLDTLSQTHSVSSRGLFAFMVVGKVFEGKSFVGDLPQQMLTLLTPVKREHWKAVWQAACHAPTPNEAIERVKNILPAKRGSYERTDAVLGTTAFNAAVKHASKMSPTQRAELIKILSD